jgi:hypothetical protein
MVSGSFPTNETNRLSIYIKSFLCKHGMYIYIARERERERERERGSSDDYLG